ncbi:hypothetical protein KJ966_07310 [bacterium]|nr:hypothetical protein [bacterium]
MRKRRIPDEKIAEIVSDVNFNTVSSKWMPNLEKCFHKVLKYEYYLNKIPDNLALPKYRKLVIRIVYRLFCQIHPAKLEFTRDIRNPDPIIGQFMDYLVEAEINRKQYILDNNPLTQDSIRSALFNLKREFEI